MKTLFSVLLLCLALSAGAATQADYQDAVLKSYRTVSNGASCNTSESGSTANTNCSDNRVVQYTIVVADQTFTVEHMLTKKGTLGAVASLGWSNVFAKNSVLWGQLPGTSIKVRSEDGVFHIKIGKRESLYRLVGAQ